MKTTTNITSGKDHAATAAKLGLWVNMAGLWCVRYAGTDEKLYGVTEKDVELMLRREGYSMKAGAFMKLSEMQEFRLWCLEHRREGHVKISPADAGA